MDNSQAISFLQGLIGKSLKLHTTDTRMFVGELKCTDKDRNIILAQAYEYRHPSQAAIESAARTQQLSPGSSITLSMTSRFMGLVVVPGQYITKIELEQIS